MSDRDDHTRESAGVSRRTLVRAGAHAAWVVPAVTVISAAPAMAISAPISTLDFSGSTATWANDASNVLTVSTTVTNTTNQGRAANPLSVVFDFTGLGFGTVTRLSTPAGWTVTGSSPTFTFSHTASIPPNTATTLAPTFSVSTLQDAASKSVGLTASATGFTSGTGAAVTNDNLQFSSSSTTSTGSGQHLKVATTVTDNGASIAANGLAVKFDFTGTGFTGMTVKSTPGGWNSSGSGLVFTFTNTGAIAAGAATTLAPSFDMTASSYSSGKTINLTATAASHSDGVAAVGS